jgi:hypothetical protein
MDDIKENKSNVRWVVVVVLLMLGIDGLLTRLLENIWVSLRDSRSPAYLPLEWWMAAPFTLFVFAVLSALLTRFSGGKNWLNTFCLLCGCKIVFTAVTAFFFSSRLYLDPVEAALQAGLLSLPSLLVHILLSGILVLFLKETFAEPRVREERGYPFVPLAGERIAASRADHETPYPIPETPSTKSERRVSGLGDRSAQPADGLESSSAVKLQPAEKEPEAITESGQVLLPVGGILKSFPEDELAMSPSEIERATPVISIPLEDIVPQLSEGRVRVEARTVISAMPADAFARSRDEVAATFPDGMMDLPLRDIVSRLPSDVLELPEQERQLDVDAEYADFFYELEPRPGAATVAVKKPAPAAAARPAFPGPQPLFPARPLPARPAAERELSEEALVISEKERALLERSRDVITVNTEAILSQLPRGAMIVETLGEEGRVPDSLLVPLELISPGLAAGEVKLHAKYIFPQFPEGCLAISELEIARSLPDAEVKLALREIVPQLPSHFLTPPEQILQPELEEMPDPFPEEAPPVAREAPPTKAAAPPRGPSNLSDLSDASDVSAAPARAPAASYADMLREANPLELPIEAVVRLLPEGAFRVSPAQLKQHIGGETIRLPRSIVMGQLKEGRVVVPVEILTAQFAPEHLGMSIEQVKARLAEGFVELPLRDLVGQVLEEIAQPVERQRPQPECDEMPAPFEEPVLQEPAAAEVMAVARTLSPDTKSRRPRDPIPETQSRKSERGVWGLGDRVAHPAESAGDEGVAPATGGVGEPACASHADRQKREGGIVDSRQETGDGRTILRTLLQKCKSLGISEHLCFAVGDSSAVVMAPPGLNRELMASGIVGVMADMRRFCGEYQLGEPFKLAVDSENGVVVGGELVRGNPNRLIVLGSLNRSGGGTMSLLLDRYEPELRNLPSIMGDAAELRQAVTAGEWQAKRTVLQEDGFSSATLSGVGKGACEKALATLSEVGIESWVSAAVSNQKIVAAWGEGFDGNRLLTDGVFDIGLLLEYSSRIGAGDLGSALLVAQHAYVTLTRLPRKETGDSRQETGGGRAAYLLCFFSPRTSGEGLVRAKVARAAQVLAL